MKSIKLPQADSSANFNAIDPIDGRYYDAETATYLSESSRITYQAYVEAALAYTLADFKVCTLKAAKEIESSARNVTAEAVSAEEQVTRHDIKALVNCIKKGISDEAKPFVHFGATSYDIVATALSLQLRDAVQEVVLPRLLKLEKTLLDLSLKYAATTQVGRTHGQHALPITFGFALSEYVNRLGENIVSLERLGGELPGKFSGAVGAYNALSIFIDDPVKFESSVLEKLSLKPAPYSSQIIPADCYVRLIYELSISGGIMANLSHDMRHLQRSEIAEVRESFEPGQTGSSTMAHKRNPWNFENVISMNKQLSSQIINANLNLSSEHQRDLTDSASARFYGQALAIVASMAARLDKVMSKIEVDKENMHRNLYLSGGAIAAEPLYLMFEKYGHISAHEESKRVSLAAMDSNTPLLEAVRTDAEISGLLSRFTKDELRILEEPEKYYTGLAKKKTRKLYDHWQTLLFG